MTRDERIRLWSALSEVFVDNAIDHAAIARQLIIYDRTTVQAAFFEEVAPVCHSNLLAPIPPIWTGFNSAWLAAAIDSRQARRNSPLRRLFDRALIAYLRYRFKPEWRAIERELQCLAGETPSP